MIYKVQVRCIGALIEFGKTPKIRNVVEVALVDAENCDDAVERGKTFVANHMPMGNIKWTSFDWMSASPVELPIFAKNI